MKKTAGPAATSALFAPYAFFFDELAAIYAEMDRQYGAVAAEYGFACSGCADNCCLTRFYHHTHIEHVYLLKGFFSLDARTRTDILQRAETAVEKTAQADVAGQSHRVMCPLNMKTRCRLYEFRPMICRLHGIPHEIRAPGRNPVFGPGCAEFVSGCGEQEYVRFDRTPFYARMANLEQRFKSASGFHDKFKKTVAGMIVAADAGAAGEIADETG
jgi:hypothetical protein